MRFAHCLRLWSLHTVVLQASVVFVLYRVIFNLSIDSVGILWASNDSAFCQIWCIASSGFPPSTWSHVNTTRIYKASAHGFCTALYICTLGAPSFAREWAGRDSFMTIVDLRLLRIVAKAGSSYSGKQSNRASACHHASHNMVTTSVTAIPDSVEFLFANLPEAVDISFSID